MTQRQARSIAALLAAVIAALIITVIEEWPALNRQIKAPLQTMQQSQPGLVSVVSVSDGDTIDAIIDGRRQRVRLIGVDTPETKDPRRPVQCFGEAASRFTTRQLLGKNVRLAADPEGDDRDKYDRLLRYVYLPDGTLFNARLIEEGYAFAYTIFPYEKLEEFRALERAAREANRGLWAGCEVYEERDRRQTSP